MMILETLGFLHLSFADILDILMVAVIIFLVFRWFRGSSAINILIAVVILLLLRAIVSVLGMRMMSAIMGAILDVGVIALIVIFQPEARRFLYRLGGRAAATGKGSGLLGRILGQSKPEMENATITAIVEACFEMSASKTGALIIIRRTDRLEDIISGGDTIDALVSTRMIENIFFKNSPMHDGAMVIDMGRIVATRCTLPMTDRTDIPASYGMRHKAALGISERTDADVVVVSEQTGAVSHVKGGALTRIKNKYDLAAALGAASDKSDKEEK